jgi:hypothetical protein
MVPVAKIRVDEGSQLRSKISPAVIRAYAAAMKEQLAEGGLRFPPVFLFQDGSNYWVGDGYYRVRAAQKAGLTEILAEVRPGTQRDALFFGIKANQVHGLPRTNTDKRKVVAFLLADSEWSQWNDREIARYCQVGNGFVSRLRRGLSVSGTQITGRKVRRNGTVYEMNVSPIGAARKAAPATDPLGIPLPEARAKVFAALSDFHEAKALFDRLAELVNRIGQGPGGELYRQELIRTASDGQPGFACPVLRVARAKLVAAEPYCAYCPRCEQAHPGRTHPTCKTCGGRGWTTQAAFESCPPGDRQPILAMRTDKPPGM